MYRFLGTYCSKTAETCWGFGDKCFERGNMKRTILKYILALPTCASFAFSMECINKEQHELINEIKDSSSVYEQCKQSVVIDAKQECVTTQINSEVNNKTEEKSQIHINDEKQNAIEIPQKNSTDKKTEEKANTVTQYMRTLTLISETNSLQRIWENIDKFNIDNNTLVALDIDQTILKSMEITAAPRHKKQWEELEEIFAILYPIYVKQRNFYVDIFLRESKEILTENIWKEFINHLKSQGAKVLVVTAIKNDYLISKDLKPTKMMWVELRHKQLNDAIDSEEQTITNVFDGDLSLWLGEKFKSPYYFNGILTTRPWSKDRAVSALLRHWGNWRPNKLIAIDDQEQNLIDYALLSLNKNMQFMGYKYTRANYIPFEYKFDLKRAFFQQMYLFQNKKWLSDKEAESELQKCNICEKQKLRELMEMYCETYKKTENKRSKTPNITTDRNDN